MKIQEVVWLLGADEDLASIFEIEVDLTGDCPRANQLMKEIETQLHHLLQFPLMGRRINNSLRRVLIGKQRYGLYYAVESNRVVVHAILNLQLPPHQIKYRLDL